MKKDTSKKVVNIIIDSAQNNKTTVSCQTDNKYIGKKEMLKNGYRGEDILLLLDQILNEKGLTLKNISNINVNTKGGSFTGLRIGVCIARTFGFLLNIKINGKYFQEDLPISYLPSKYD